MLLRDRVQDEAVAAAKARCHAAVEPRHVLFALLRCLGDAAPAEVDRARVAALLMPDGVATAPPAIAPEAEASLARLTTTDAGVAEAKQLVTTLGLSGPAAPATPPDAAGGAPAVSGSAAAVATQTQMAEPDKGAGPKPAEDTATVLAELDALVGLAPVKTAVRQLVAMQRFNAERAKAGLPQVGEGRHLVFTGNPGTGKTTVARLLARLYGSLGVLSRGHLVETGRADLVAGYVGQTALKVRDVVMSAMGGVLLIDEAYALATNERADFGGEAIATLVKLMEDKREDLVVIAAGYHDEMVNFIDSNPGLRSRFTQYVDFPDYSPDELLRIFKSMAAASGVKLGEGVDAAFLAVVDQARATNFGNGRFVRTAFEGAYANLASRALADGVVDASELDLLLPSDLPGPDAGITAPHRPIGFRPGEPARG